AKYDGVEFVTGVEPVEITDEGTIFVRIEKDDEGNKHRVEGSEKLYPASSTIIAVSQGPKNRIVSSTTGLDITDRGLLVTNTYGATTRDGIFAAGDVVLGARTVVEAVNYSKQVAEAMDKYLQGLKSEG
ncbi:MAG: FAD-dependent oxidoreductase, partial [Ruminiclostridium sp.]|nr:FAD-dependent oxidoreductase [Ruminiclostridium sp.]